MDLLAGIAANKDALIPMAAIISSVVALAGVISGPRTQRWIAKTTFRTNRDHQWVADFRQAVAEALGIAAEHYVVSEDHLEERRGDVGRQAEMSMAKIQLMVSQSDGEELRQLYAELLKMADEPENVAGRSQRRRSFLAKAMDLVEQRERPRGVLARLRAAWRGDRD